MLGGWKQTLHAGGRVRQVSSSAVRFRVSDGTGPMRIVSWNCCQALRNKWEYLAAFDPDLIGVAEAEEPERLPVELRDRYPHYHWIGDIRYKGLLVMATSEHPLRVHDAYTPEHRYVLPVEVGGPNPLTVVAAWTQRDKHTYTEHLWHALHEYVDVLAGDTVVIGDFNANAIWDKDHRRDVTHSQIVEWLAGHGLTSAYHALTGEAQGEESTATHAFRRDRESLFHIDYAFVSDHPLAGVQLAIPAVEDWVARSDHGPLVLDLP